MLFISLIVSALLLLIANWSARRSEHPGARIVCFSGAFLVAPFFLMCVLPAVAIQALLLCVATIVWRATHRGPSFFLRLSCVATLVAYGLSGTMALMIERDYARLRARYPYESMEDRVPAPQAFLGGTPLPLPTVERLSRLEEQISSHDGGFRRMQLSRLHENAVGLFIDSPGFGVARMILPSESGLDANRHREPVPPQPGPRFISPWSPGRLARLPSADEAPLGNMLEGSILDFVYPRGFGLIKDRRHVAGFETHGFGRVPEPTERWKVQHLELVSLLLHDAPEVYVSPDLPQMDRLHGVPTRPLDRFEEFGLNAIRRGDNIFTAQVDEGVRMLGAIRSTETCVSCHGGVRGDLLGAFSYALRADKP